MRWRLVLGLKVLLFRKRTERELDEELKTHLELQSENMQARE